MAIITMGLRDLEGVIELGHPGTMCFEARSIDNSETDLPPMTPLMVSGSDLVPADASASEAIAVNCHFIPANAAAVVDAVIYRAAELNNNDMNWGALDANDQATIVGELALVGIRVRTS